MGVMNASPNTPPVFFCRQTPAGNIRICHEKSCFHQPLQLISIPGKVTASQKTEGPGPAAENMVKSSVPCLALLLAVWPSLAAPSDVWQVLSL